MKRLAIVLFSVIILALYGAGGSKAAAKETEPDKKAAVVARPQEMATQKTAKAKQSPVQKADGKKNTVKEKDTAEEKKPAKEAAKKEKSPVENKKEEKAEKEEEKKLPDYKVTAFEETKIMYASNPVNVRKGPTTDFERVGGLNRAQEVTVTGQADTDWYEILYGEEKAYVSDHYLQNEIPAEEPQPEQAKPQEGQAPPQPVQAVTEVKNVAGVIMVGDSRFVQMQANIGENSCTWIAENGKGYKWFSENAVPRIDGCVGKGSKILINLGVNDPGNMKNYAELVNAKAAEWISKGAAVYYASVNPVWENPYVTEEQVEYFNSQLQGSLSGDIHWIDSHTYLNSIGYKLVDGLHFNAETYQNLYAYFMSCL